MSEYSNHRVQKFNINGEYLLQFGYQGSGNGQLYSPGGITVQMRDCTLLSIVIVAFQYSSLLVNSVALLGQDS